MKIFTTVIVGALLIGGVSVGAQVLTKEDAEKDLQQVHSVAPVAVSIDNDGITLSDATDIALAKVENGIITEAERDREKGRLIYEIEVKNEQFEYEFKIDQQSGEIIKEEQEVRSSKKRNHNHLQSTNNNEFIISIDKAKEIALNEVHGTIDDIELERENGSLIYEMEIETDGRYGDDDEATIYIEALTGKVLYVEWDD
ncbi:PepSY domain-containing protein [Alkalihalobacterium alkalinitrilicum]|uniref:PepSY domain-containing protein n=1 Tax=Alkalihalobacterium alkalinitrilicum TaxID=427920 RepID=UPI000994BDA4|nr:PepSY domain-containing protein [Alkalihalobacterium alkalinitrilicum]